MIQPTTHAPAPIGEGLPPPIQPSHPHRAVARPLAQEDRRPRTDDSPEWLLVTDVDDTLLGNAVALSTIRRTDRGLTPHRCRSELGPADLKPAQVTLRDLKTDFEPLGNRVGLRTRGDNRGSRHRDRTRRRTRGGVERTTRSIRPGSDRYGHGPTRMQAPCRRVPDTVQGKLHGADPTRSRGQEARSPHRRVKSKIITSGTTNFDVIPATAGKGAAMRFVRDHLGIRPRHTIAAGDSLNDLEMLRVAGAQAIVVGNATPRLKKAMRDSNAYMAKRTHAAGILEGLRRLRVPLRFALFVAAELSTTWVVDAGDRCRSPRHSVRHPAMLGDYRAERDQICVSVPRRTSPSTSQSR